MLEQLKKTPRVNGYTSPKAEPRISPIQGIGIFAKERIKKGEVVAAWGGRVTTKEEIEKLPEEIAYNYALMLYPGFYLAERDLTELDAADFFNHACEPNCVIVDRFVLLCDKDIEAGEEVTADFSSDRHEGGSFVCKCGSKKCKGTIWTG